MAAVVNNHQRLLFIYGSSAVNPSLPAALLYEPGSRDFHQIFSGRVVRNDGLCAKFCLYAFQYGFIDRLLHHGILEETSRAAGFGRLRKFALADLSHYLSYQ